MAEKKKTYYKIGKSAQSFFCSLTRLKVNKGAPGVLTSEPSKGVIRAESNGHIIKISEDEYLKLMAETQALNDESIANSKNALKASVKKLTKQFGEEALKAEVGGGSTEAPKNNADLEDDDDDDDDDEVTEEAIEAIKSKADMVALAETIEGFEVTDEFKGLKLKDQKEEVIEFIT